jgi:hypothetical protein
MSQVSLDLAGIARGKDRIPEPIADAFTALQTGHNDTDTKLTNVTTGHDHDGTDSKKITAASMSDYTPWTAYTPVVTGGTAAGTGTYSSQKGWYMKLAKKVTAIIEVSYSNHTGTGNWECSLPIAAGTFHADLAAMGSIALSGANINDAARSIACAVSTGLSKVYIFQTLDNDTMAALPMVNEGVTAYLTIEYPVD